MNNNKKFYIERIADDARNAAVAQHIHSKYDTNLTYSQLNGIITLFGGEYEPNAPNTQIEKTGANKFKISYTRDANYIDVLHELGHAFLNLDDMNIGDVLYCNGSSARDDDAGLFARSYAMPRDNFEKVVAKCVKDGVCMAQDVAKEFKAEYFDVISRGIDLNIWE